MVHLKRRNHLTMCLGSLFTKQILTVYIITGMIKYFGIDNYNMGIIHIIDISSKDKDINHNGKFLISIIFYYSLLNYSFDFDRYSFFYKGFLIILLDLCETG
ncbi:hypothetical protein BDF21DRAFT_399862 [Thamnidium elegans]|nr:hypothetical protein BDF21DRAFT_399862 [Thamnidium elegans]